jgi:hypothetical protein
MDDKELVIEFPFKGVDVSRGLFDQREGTSPFAVNVRGTEDGNRARGSTRPGLSPYIGGPGSTEQVEGFHLIQSLSAIVTASQAATFSSNFIIINFDVHYSESNNPPVRDSPLLSVPITWYENTKPNPTIVTNQIIGTPDGGGTGKGTAKFKISTDLVNVTLQCTFISAGFPPVGADYFYAGKPKTFTLTQLASTFFAPSGHFSDSWTVVSGSFIGNYFFNVYRP